MLMRQSIGSICLSVLTFILSASVFSQSPYKCSWTKDGIIFGANLATGISALAVDNLSKPVTPEEINRISRQSLSRFDRGATYNFSTNLDEASDAVVGISITAPIVLLLDSTIRKDWNTITIMYIETMMISVSLPSLGKGAAKRIRPFVYNPNVPLEKKTTAEARKSFFSRHTTLAFASAVFISTVYSNYYPQSDWKPYIWAGSLLGAGCVGYLRYESGSHFPTDIITGGLIGGVIGYLIPLLHQMSDENLSVYPSIGQSSGISMQIKF